MKVRPLHPHAALLLEDDRRYVAVSDLHIGLEAELALKGVTVRQTLVPDMLAELFGLIESEHADGVVLLGDVKHTVGSISKQEWEDIPSFLKQLSARADVYLVPGNHDSNIRHLVPESVNVASAKGMALVDTLLVHGHAMPSDLRSGVRRIVMGHVHPVFVKKGSVVSGQRVWVSMQARKEALFSSEAGLVDVVVVPSFNPYLHAAGEKCRHKSISPIITRMVQAGVEKCIVATLDGSVVGDAAVLPDVL
ncbi:MAG TPA: metallophosphoesterase [Nitrososphaera sp.]|nr:metallophosphoesterase [Nitrososphaera sp.]